MRRVLQQARNANSVTDPNADGFDDRRRHKPIPNIRGVTVDRAKRFSGSAIDYTSRASFAAGHIGRKWIEADVVARPAGTLEARTFLAATRAACTSAQLVAGSIWPPSDDSDRAKQAARDAGSAHTTATPKALTAVARRVWAVVQVGACGNSAAGWWARQATLYVVGHVRALHL